MNSKLQILTIILLITILLPLSIMSTCVSANYENTYSFQAKYGLLNQKLFVSVTPSLYDYYVNLNHTIDSPQDYVNFVTPNAVTPIAASIQNITDKLPYSNEQFADAVLAMVHEITYNVTEIRYPVETIEDNSGDCVSLSLLAASIMQAGGLDVVLILYTGINPEHMNVGVYLPYTPVFHSLLMLPTSFKYDNKSYWTAETTSEAGWKVGDQSSSLAGATPVIIPLNNDTALSPTQVSSSLVTTKQTSAISINISENSSDEENNTRSLNVEGAITPAIPDTNVAIYFNNGSTSTTTYCQVKTDDLGRYSLTWNFTNIGTYNILASWSGTSDYVGSDSQALTFFVGSESIIQFQTPYYNYIYEPENPIYEIFGSATELANLLPSLQGLQNFLSLPLGSNVTLSCDFILLPSGHPVTNVPATTETVQISQSSIALFWRGRYYQPQTISTQNETLTVPENVPSNMEPLYLPDNFNQTINNQFCFDLQNTDGSGTLNFEALNGQDLSNITQAKTASSAFMNYSSSIEDGAWYTIKATITQNGLTANVFTQDGTAVGNTLISTGGAANLVLLLANNANSVLAVKNLTFNSTNVAVQPSPTPTLKASGVSTLLTSELFLTIVLMVTVAATLFYVVWARRTRIDDYVTENV